MQREWALRLSGTAIVAVLGSLLICGPALAQSTDRQADITTLIGYNSLTNGYHDQIYTSILGNTYLRDGVGLHSEIAYVDREETGALFTGGMSLNSERASLKAMIGTSTDVQSILPEFYSRLSAELRSDPGSGWIFNPAYTIRTYREGLTDQTAEVRLVKYLPAGPSASVIVELVGREGFLDPGPDWIPSAMAGLTYSNYKKYSIGLAAEAGRAEYDALVGIGSVNEPYYAIRPSASMYVNDHAELFARGDYTHRASYDSVGGLVGVKLYIDE